MRLLRRSGEVDRHYFRRVLLPAAVRFAEGFLTALGRPAESLSVDGGVRYERLGSSTRDAVHTGLGTAARSAGEILLEGAPKRPTVRIPRDTELVVLFARPPGAAPQSTGARIGEREAAMAESNDLGQAMIALVRDLEPGLLLLVSALCYLLALAAFAQGLMRLLKTSEDKFHAPSGGGTALSFLICIVMAALPSWLTAAGESLFGAGAPSSAASLGYGGRGADYDALLAAVFTVVGLVGLIAFIRRRVRAARRRRRQARRNRPPGLRPHGRRHRRLAHRGRDRGRPDQPRHRRAEHPLKGPNP